MMTHNDTIVPVDTFLHCRLAWDGFTMELADIE